MLNDHLPRAPSERGGSTGPVVTAEHSGCNSSEPSSATVLELLGDEYTREVLRAVSNRPRNVPEIAEWASISKTTAYGRLDRLEEAGLVTSRLVIDPDGNHHREFSAAFDGVTVRLDCGDVSTDVEFAAADPSRADGSEEEPKTG